MTISEWCEKHLYDNGLSADDATAVLDHFRVKYGHKLGLDAIRWSDKTSNYPAPLLTILKLALDSACVEWIDANCPQHWARAAFVVMPHPGGQTAGKKGD